MDDVDIASERERQEGEYALRRELARIAAENAAAPPPAAARDCLECGLPIGARRLRAAPGAVRCIECQTWHERSIH
jgi:phage/conjugal plasmid C-4 type zinc finger TraR family protein